MWQQPVKPLTWLPENQGGHGKPSMRGTRRAVTTLSNGLRTVMDGDADSPTLLQDAIKPRLLRMRSSFGLTSE